MLMNNITVYKCDHTGDVVWQYQGVVIQRDDHTVCLTALFNTDQADLGFVTFRRGDVFTEWFYTDRWYNVFRIQDGQTSRLKGWYCNITRPAAIMEDSVRADDLALDVMVMPNGNVVLLDEDEFAALELSSVERMEALRAVEAIRHAAAERHFPFDEILTETDRLR
jgi:hypothetical protein